MKILTALSFSILLTFALGCNAPADDPDTATDTSTATEASAVETPSTETPAASEEGAISSMDFESGDTPSPAPADTADEPAEEAEDAMEENGGDATE